MTAGMSGHLITEAFLEHHLRTAAAGAAAAGNRRLTAWMRHYRQLGPASSVRALVDVGAAPLVRALGFHGLADMSFSRQSAAATLIGISPPVTVLVTPWGERLDPFWRDAVVESRRRRTPWCVLFNGTHIRLIDAGRLHARRYVEFDIQVALGDERTTAALEEIFSAGSFAAGRDGTPIVRTLIAGSEEHAAGVSRSLKSGVLRASSEILQAIVRHPPPASLDETFEQALTIVYRILFLFFAEARGLVPLWHPVYRESYSVETLRQEAERDDAAPGLWDTLRAITRLAHAGCQAGDLRVTAFNGRLFAPARTPLADRPDLDDGAACRAVLALSTRATADRSARERIGYRDLGVEQLGAVYETLLDYVPRVRTTSPAPRRQPRVALEPGSGVRKATGAFYTPQAIAHWLVRRTLTPLVTDLPPERILELRVLDPAMGSGAFLVAACTFLADAYETAAVRAGGCHPSDIGPAERVAIRRTVAERCLFGVDVNPMAVQLARLSLWLATLSADKPLGFLDHHLQAGDSLLGAWLSSLRDAGPPRRRRPAASASSLFGESNVATALEAALPIRFALSHVPNDTLAQVREKERALAALNRDSAISKWKRVADLWCARWFDRDLPASVYGAVSDAILTGRSPLPEPHVAQLLQRAEALAAVHRFFHWELEFPEAFFENDGTRRPLPGFDAIVGNPPWDMMRADAGPPERRAGTRRALGAIVRFTRDSGVYAAQSTGHANRYQLFVERSVALTRPGGRVGLVLPWGLLGDHGSRSLRRLLLAECSIDSIVGFENRRGLFPIHRSVRFVMTTATRGRATVRIGCRLGEQDPSVLENSDGEPGEPSWFPLHITPALLERLSGDERSLPYLRSPVDLTIAERAAALSAPLGDRAGWAVRFGRELNASDDREHFVESGEGVPVVEGKAIAPFRVLLDATRYRIRARVARRLLGGRFGRPRLAYRDVASASNRLTLIAALLPARAVSTHTVFCLRTPLPLRSQLFLCGMFNSLVVNYLVRLRVTTHVTTAIVEGLPVPSRAAAGPKFGEIAALARVLSRCDEPAARARLDASVARLYQLDRGELEHVLGTFPLVPIDERNAVLRAFDEGR
jgi:hypothetical protein